MLQIVLKSADADAIARSWGMVGRVARLGTGEEAVLDVSALTGTSAALEAFVLALNRRAAARGVTLKAVDPQGLLAHLLDRYDVASYDLAAPRRRAPSLFDSVGRAACGTAAAVQGHLACLGETAVTALGMLVHPRRFRLRDALWAFQRAGFDGLPITLLIGFLLGLILAFESAASLRMFGVEVYVADLIAIGLFRELGPLITAIILAGRSGSAFAAEIGTMKVDEELDALTTMGLPPVRFLVLPRIVAATLVMPVLTMFSEMAGLIGGCIVLQMMDVPASVFWGHVTSSSSVSMIVLGLAKSALFGLLVGFISCASGMRTKKAADGVGEAATNAVVCSIVAIAVADGLLAVVCYVLGI